MHAKLRSALSRLALHVAQMQVALQSIVGEELAQGPNLAAKVGFQPATIRTKGDESTNEPPTKYWLIKIPTGSIANGETHYIIESACNNSSSRNILVWFIAILAISTKHALNCKVAQIITRT